MAPTPHDLDAENALLGDMLALPDIIGDVAERVTGADFMQPLAGAAFNALVAAWRAGEALDVVALAGLMREVGADPDPRWLQTIASSGSGAWRRHAKAVVDHRVRRQLLAAVGEIEADARNPTADPTVVMDRLRAHLTGIHIPDGNPPADLWALDDFLDTPEHEHAPWIVPGLLRQGWRVIVVGGEGSGKSTLWRQFAVLSAQGIHPLGFERITPVRTLLVDLENSADAVTAGCKPIREQVQRNHAYESGRAWIWHRPGGIDLRTRASRHELAAVCAKVRPQLVTLGPLYKAYHRGKDSDEEAAAEVQHVLDDLRTRFGFALLLEHHAGQDIGGVRTFRPYGTSLWLRWPEVGLAMNEDKNTGVVTLGRWRGDRIRNGWPQHLHRGDAWPWVGRWDNPDQRTPE